MHSVGRFAFWSAANFALVMALVPHPPPIPGQPSDKVLHVVAFAVLTSLAANAYRKTSLLWLGIALSAFGAAIEFAQMIPVLHRDAQILDWIADTSAVATVGASIALYRYCGRPKI